MVKMTFGSRSENDEIGSRERDFVSKHNLIEYNQFYLGRDVNPIEKSNKN